MSTEHDPLNTAPLEDQRAAEAQEAERLAKQARDDFLWLMGDKRGRRLMWGWLAQARVFQPIFEPSSRIYFNEGMRNFGCMFLTAIHEHCPEAYLQMVREVREAKETTQ
ncbi:hypothetical protein CAL26_09955 [Bordetella genomosp. 9]|uniref:Bbp19-like phage domain-containing protein n=1 Tax=Bordetella genomosp. 9 TaxID=1416803 RepID=A0A261RFE2_9BORD|nr:hypothetical protein [Bordetella genomosp. 9]OZI23744.1 hypothetical protein CAL26_09955 [Bordetella genomosp. 9]